METKQVSSLFRFNPGAVVFTANDVDKKQYPVSPVPLSDEDDLKAAIEARCVIGDRAVTPVLSILIMQWRRSSDSDPYRLPRPSRGRSPPRHRPPDTRTMTFPNSGNIPLNPYSNSNISPHRNSETSLNVGIPSPPHYESRVFPRNIPSLPYNSSPYGSPPSYPFEFDVTSSPSSYGSSISAMEQRHDNRADQRSVPIPVPRPQGHPGHPYRETDSNPSSARIGRLRLRNETPPFSNSPQGPLSIPPVPAPSYPGTPADYAYLPRYTPQPPIIVSGLNPRHRIRGFHPLRHIQDAEDVPGFTSSGMASSSDDTGLRSSMGSTRRCSHCGHSSQSTMRRHGRDCPDGRPTA